MGHPEKKQLIEIAMDFRGDIPEALSLHVKECRDCADTLESLKLVMRSSDNSLIAPPEHIKADILSSIESHGQGRISSRKFLRPLIGAAAAIIVAVTVITLYYSGRETAVEVALRLSPDHGNILYENVALKGRADIKRGRIITGNISAAVLSLQQAMSVRIAEDSDLSLINALEYQVRDNKKYDIIFELKNGSVMVSSDHDLMRKYTIATPHGIFEPVGTGFVLSADQSSSKLSVTEGIVRVTTSDKNEIILKKGEGCEINGGVRRIIIDPESVINSFNEVFGKTEVPPAAPAERSLIEGVPAADTELGKDNAGEPGDNTGRIDPDEAGKDIKKLKDNSDLRDEVKEMQKGMRKNRSGRGQ